VPLISRRSSARPVWRCSRATCRTPRPGSTVPADRAAGFRVAGKLSGRRRKSMRAGRPRSRGCRPDGAVEDIRRATSLKVGGRPLENGRFPAIRRPHPPRADHTRVKQVLFQIGTTEPPFLPRTFGQTRFALPYTPQGQASRDRLLRSRTHPRPVRTRSHVHHQGHDTLTQCSAMPFSTPSQLSSRCDTRPAHLHPNSRRLFSGADGEVTASLLPSRSGKDKGCRRSVQQVQ